MVHNTTKELIRLKLISGQATINVFDKAYADILTYKYKSEADFMTHMWSRYKSGPYSASLNGNVFEGLLAVIFYRSGIVPLYVQAKLCFVPNIDFDFVAYCEEYGPVILSAKTSLRERYKQADLEGMMLRHVHRAAKSFLITLDAKEAKTVNEKIKNDLALGLDEVVVATAPEFNKLIRTLKSFTYKAPPKVDVLTSKRVIS